MNLERPFYLNMFKVTHFLSVIHRRCLCIIIISIHRLSNLLFFFPGVVAKMVPRATLIIQLLVLLDHMEIKSLHISKN